MEHDFRIDINRSVEPRFLFVSELNLFLIDRNTVRLYCEVLLVIISVGSVLHKAVS